MIFATLDDTWAIVQVSSSAAAHVATRLLVAVARQKIAVRRIEFDRTGRIDPAQRLVQHIGIEIRPIFHPEGILAKPAAQIGTV